MFLFQENVVSAVICGDGRYDSPGFSAKFMTYFIQVKIYINICTIYQLFNIF